MKIYMDVCCLNRPFDNQGQDRIYLESEAILTILARCQSGEWALAASAVIELELSKMTNVEKLEKVRALYSLATGRLEVSEQIFQRARQLQGQGLKLFDSLHLALAEIHRQDVLLTTDDGFLTVAKRVGSGIPVLNPVSWLMEVTRNE